MDMNKILANKGVVDLVKGKMSESVTEIVNQQSAIIDIMNEQTKALVSLYQAVKTIAEAKKIKLPKPLVDMDIKTK